MIYQGSCHCKAITFEVEAPEHVEVVDCNCSMCAKAGFLHLIRPLSAFTLLTGQKAITSYTFNSGIAKHTFCKHCGVKPFYTPRSNPDGIDINLRCLDPQPQSVSIEPFDGQNWEDNAASLAHKSH
mgnify:CR=1 FL=1